MKKRDQDVVSTRLLLGDREVLDWVKNYIGSTFGAGVLIGDSDAVRWALHTCKRGLSSDEVGVAAAELPGGLGDGK